MPLPGKLCIGILEEDNPQKSYFRFKPVLVEEGGRYIPYDEPDSYPEDGCIRIVPDKNESSYFKARMRRIGLFAVVDLREHANENDKIRVNKNYHGDDGEHNAHIIYSDVVREPAAGMIFSLLRLSPEEAANAALTEPAPTAKVLLRPESDVLNAVWVCEPDAEQADCFHLRSDDASVCIDDLQIFDLPGFQDSALSFAILPPTKVERLTEPSSGKPSKAQQQEARKEAESSKAEEKPSEAAAEKNAEPKHEVPAEPKKEAPAEPKKEAPEEPENPPEKPWISRGSAPAERPAPRDLSPHQRTLAVQSGLNPRRGRSLQEIVDEKWRHSRIDQLGHPVPPLATASPVDSPVEHAVAAVRQVWDSPAQRSELVSAFVQMEGLDSAMDARRAAVREHAVNRQLTELEAQRLEMLGDLERLKRNGAEVREALKAEIRRDEADAFAAAVRKTREAQDECARHQDAAAQAKAAAEAAQDAMNALSDGRFEQRLHEFAINSRAMALLKAMDDGAIVAPELKGADADADELIRRVLECFADAGQPIDRAEAINLLICAAQSPIVLFTGAPGSGKTSTARLLARALGVENVRYAEYAPGAAPVTDDFACGDVPAIALLDDANLCTNADLTRGLTPAAERGELTLFVTLQDDGVPVPAHLFGRAFALRLDEDCAEWPPKPVAEAKTYAPVTADALKRAFGPTLTVLPDAQAQRLEQLRADLALLDVRLSKKTLRALWNYCAAAIPLMNIEPSAVLDLAIAQRVIPAVLAGAPLGALTALPALLEDLPRSKRLLSQPLPIAL